MTDEEYRAYIRDALPSLTPPMALSPPAPSMGLQGAPDFAARLSGPTSGPVGRAAEIASGHSPGDLLSLSGKAQARLGAMPPMEAPGGLQPMDTPLASVNGAPALNPGYAQVGRPMGGMGGPGPGNGLKAAFDAAQRKQLAEMGVQRELTGDLGAAQVGRTMAVSKEEQDAAAWTQEQAMAQQRINDAAHAKLQAFGERNQQLADEIASAKVDTGRWFRNKDIQTKITMGIGAIASGMLRGLQGGPNAFLDRMDGYIDQDIRAQQDEISNKKASLSARQGIYGQMLQETGDSRLAADQSRALMLQGIRADLKAKTDLYGIPEARATTELAMNGIDQRIAGAQTGIAQAAWEWAQRQAAAAAAAQAAAQREAWAHSMQIAELGLKGDELAIKRAQASGQTFEDLNKQTQSLGTALGAKDLTEGRAAVDNAKRRLQGLKPDEGLPGVGRVADARAGLRPEGINTLNPLMQAANAVAGLSDAERVSRGDWEKIKLAYQHQITGSGASEGERKMLSAAFEGARGPAEQRNAISQADDFFARREAAIKAGYDPGVVKVFEARREGIQPTLPSSVQVKR